MHTLVRALLLLAFAISAQAQTHRPEQAEALTFPSLLCAEGTCRKIDVPVFLFARHGQTKIVLISHGSQGIDSRMYDYVDALQKDGFAALVIDHWTPRGIGVTHEDYPAASRRGGNEFNMANDSIAAAAWLRAQRGFTRVGSIGESQGGGAAIMMQQKFAHEQFERNMKRHYGSFALKPIDVVVGLYPYCGYRNAKRDAYVDTPLLLVTGADDNETPSRYCERHVGWMNERGGNAKIVVLPDEGHSFDAPYRRQRSLGPHYAKCDILVDERGTTELNSGQHIPVADVTAMMARCVSRGYHTGYWKDRFVGVPHWMGFFKQHL
jgi:dienelactone hydrolase